MDAPLTVRERKSLAELLVVVEEWRNALRSVRTSAEFLCAVDQILAAMDPYRSQLAAAVSGAGSLNEVSEAMQRASERLGKIRGKG